MDYFELLDFLAFDVEAAHKAVEEKRRDLEKVQPKSVREKRGGLRCPCCSCRPGFDMEGIILVVVP